MTHSEAPLDYTAKIIREKVCLKRYDLWRAGQMLMLAGIYYCDDNSCGQRNYVFDFSFCQLVPFS